MKNKIAQIGDPFLRKPTEEIPVEAIKKKKIKEIINKMIKIMHEHNGAGLAANQVFEKYRICIIEIINNSRYKHIPEIPLKILINPKITYLNKKKLFSSYEGCLSVPNIRGRVLRSYDIEIEYYNQYAELISEKIFGYEAIVYQHEIDHLEGILFTDRVNDKQSLVTYENYLNFYEENYKKELAKIFEK